MRCLLFGFSAIYVLISFSPFGSSLENPTYNHENTVFGIQVKSEENAEISITKILEQGSLPCGSEKCNCSVEILRHVKINPEKEKLTPEDLEDISALLIHKLLYSKSICDISKHECWNFESCFKEIIPEADIADVKSSLTSILTRLNMVLTTSSNDECHSASSIFEELKNANQSEGSNLEQMRRLFTIVVTHIIKGHCFYIEGATTDFLDDIFSMYGDRCSTVIKMDGLERLMNDLQGKNHNHNHDHEHNSDDNHNHSDTEHHHHHHHADEADCEHSQHHANHLHNHSDENHEHQNYFAAQNNNGYKYNSHNHDHDHEHDHDHNHEHDHDHNHEHNHDHNHEHDHDHNHDHNHEHDLNRNHDHNHDYNERQIHAHGYYDREREDGNTNEDFMNQNFQNLTNVDNHESSTSMPESIVFNNYDQNEFKNITNQKLKHYINNPNDDDDHNGGHSSDKKNYREEFNRKNNSELSSLDSNRNAYNNSANKLDLQKHHESKISTNKSDETNINNSSLVQNEEHNPSFSTVEHNIDEHIRTIENEPKGTEMLEQVEKHKTGEDSEENKTGDDDAQDFQVHTSPATNSSINMDLDASLSFRNITDDDFKNMGTMTSNVSHNSSSNLRLPDDHHMTSSSLESKQPVHHEDKDNKNDTHLTQHYTIAPVNFTKERRKPFIKQIENLQNLHAAASRVNLASKCLSTEELMNMFGTSSNTSLTRTEFLMICPALIQQLVTGVCQKSVVRHKAIPSVGEVYGYSILSVFLISLTSLAGVVLLPILKKNVYHYIMAGCIGLAFSTLAGDALFHLIPQALNIHSHSHDEPAHDHKVDFQDPNLAKLVGIFLAIYALYIFEAVICTFSKTERHSHCPSKNGNGPRLADTKELTLISVKVQSESRSHLALSPQESASSLNTEIAENEITEKSDATMLNFPKICGLSTLALLVTLGDSIHNFGDGLAIGAAFSSGISSGLSTSIAVFCHELPHEFGDFVILLSSGLSFSKALWINFLSGLTCFIGLLIGLQIGVNEDARMWVIAVTAGIFLYVALAEMLPELRENKIGNPVKMLLAKNFGILAGMMMMITISVYEHHFII